MTVGGWIDWANDGFGTGTYDDVTANIIGWQITRGAAAEIVGGSSTGSARLTLKDPAGLYNPENASSPIHAYLEDGPAVWIGIKNDGSLAAGGTVNGLFGGRIADVTPIPAGGASLAPTVEINCVDALDWYGRQRVSIADSLTRSQGSLRADVLTAIDETRTDLDNEPTPLPLSSASGDALGVLTAINAAGGTRHFIRPGATPTAWYDYVSYSRMHGLSGVAAAALNAGSDHVVGSDGWRKSGDTVINSQLVTVEPIRVPTNADVIWEAAPETLPINVTSTLPVTMFADFSDYVADPALIETHTGSVTVAFTPFGHAAKIALTSASTGQITSLSISGRQVQRLPSIAVLAADAVSEARPRGVRAGPEIQGDYVGVFASAVGIASHLVWRYGNPQLRPTLHVANWFPYQFQLDLFDLISFTSSQLQVTSRIFEIVGLTHTAYLTTSPYHTVDYVLQESRVQAPKAWFTWDVDKWDTGPGVLGY